MRQETRPQRRTVVLVSGGGSNLQAIIDARRANLDIEVVGVISDRTGAYALERARSANIPAIVVDYAAAASRDAFAQALRAQLERLKPDLVVLAGFMRILPDALVESYRGRMLNVHPSLLPQYPGLNTYKRALAGGDEWHGSTVHFVIPELDAGPGIIQYRVRIRPGDTEDSLRERVQRGEHVIYPLAIGSLVDGRVELREGAVWRDGAPISGPLLVDEPGS